MNEKLINLFNEIEILIKENRSLIEIAYIYAENNANEHDCCLNTARILEIILNKQNKLDELLDEKTSKLFHKLHIEGLL